MVNDDRYQNAMNKITSKSLRLFAELMYSLQDNYLTYDEIRDKTVFTTTRTARSKVCYLEHTYGFVFSRIKDGLQTKIKLVDVLTWEEAAKREEERPIIVKKPKKTTLRGADVYLQNISVRDKLLNSVLC